MLQFSLLTSKINALLNVSVGWRLLRFRIKDCAGFPVKTFLDFEKLDLNPRAKSASPS
jgi:hypothetical protein